MRLSMRRAVAVMSPLALVMLFMMSGCKKGESARDYAENLTAILISPEAAVVPIGETMQMVATGIYEDRSTADVTAFVEWDTSNAAVASVSNGLDAEGLLEALQLGSTNIGATLGGVDSAISSIEVTDADILGLTVEPGSVSLASGETVQLTAFAAYSDGSRSDASSLVRWITGNGSVAKVDGTGLLEGAGEGSTTITAQWEDLQSEAIDVSVEASGQPNLTISQFEGEAAGDTLTLSITIENNGTLGASGFWVDVFVDPSTTPSPGDYGDAYAWGDYLGEGATEFFTASLTVDSGSHNVWVLLDTAQSVDESNESDNTASATISVGSSQQAGPNLQISYFDYLADGESVYYYVDVTNSGTDDVGSFYVDLYMDAYSTPALYEDGDDYVTVKSLAAGESAYADFLFDVTCSVCSSWVQVDSYDYIEETDESDNIAGPLSVYAYR